MIFMIDNYDSFTYNLVQYLGELGAELVVKRNDQFALDELERLKPDRIVVSPGPGTPNEAGLSIEVIRRFGGSIPILGVCLGHQCIGCVYGGEITRAPQVWHGKTSMIHHKGNDIFADLPNPIEATRYHSLIVRRENLPDILDVTAWTDDGLIMGMRHRQYPVFGVQFHPESILTASGKKILKNFLEIR
ncbi:MAG TPA: aminodeoxychorismate/anthranilate synthase component II [Candidatus Sumerlaeota bacterium]|nr:MAG: Aminodeoxychorismate/anthranilate synthase component 2 [candidate division BRC1 bacterium ADurb.Bin183]HOE63425.1 aminodeoxychorismate/anthranilate synthase component II [Candidatus Sumerlaeota bacterium]HRR30291.1 aminodeoxychorismate/anthranilate synthase component II [Candidatus Sumerlaeia bacterium]HON50904.1 aminodeoxychorismate/anthranilate synthase component II [Candidatus Sumerlaeota bacterium]HOR65598.1 aminodeoxychorismate/anthranilate synthase component II [Candidatus Sumerla